MWGLLAQLLERFANNAEVMSWILLRASAMEEKSLSATDRETSLSCKGFRNQHFKKRNTNSHLEESHEESAI